MRSPLPETFARARTVVDARPVTSVGLAFDTPSVSSPDENPFARRYDERELLGEGGMGEVHVYRDTRIGRDVAMKTIRPDQGRRRDLQARFLREARVQGQLEHPSIVPVYDAGSGPDGAAYFTMKRVRGLTLADIVDALRAGDPAAEKEYPLRRLLAAFSSVCLAVEFAHARRVIHRDLKPGNVMLGSFGEVYVLDWGIAKILEEVDDVVASPGDEGSGRVDSGDGLATQLGTFLGTLGYLSPEQFQNFELDGRSDVYALGAILFEMLTFVPLHQGTPGGIAVTTMSGADARCSVRAPSRDVPPELEAICVKATQVDAGNRFPTARALYEAVQKYLDGDRDTERRRALAAEHANLAMAALEAAGRDAKTLTANRALALAELGRSVTLDPSNDAALGGIVALLLEPPAEVPDEVREMVNASKEASRRQINMTGIAAFGGGAVMVIPLLLWMGVLQWTPVVLSLFFLGVAFGGCLLQVRKGSPSVNFMVMASAALTYVVLSRLLGPLVLMPALAMGTAMVYAMYPVKPVQQIAILVMTLATVVPLVLERMHALPPSYVFRDGQMIILPQMCALPEFATLALLTVLPNLLLFVGAAGLLRIRNALTAAEERLALQAWQFRQLVPEEARHRLGSARS